MADAADVVTRLRGLEANQDRLLASPGARLEDRERWNDTRETIRDAIAVIQRQSTGTGTGTGTGKMLDEIGVLVWNGRRIHLTRMMARIVKALLDADGLPVTYRDLHAAAYDQQIAHADHGSSIRGQIKRIRRIVGDDCLIINHSGVGYSWPRPALEQTHD